jgi:hypothetical protein
VQILGYDTPVRPVVVREFLADPERMVDRTRRPVESVIQVDLPLRFTSSAREERQCYENRNRARRPSDAIDHSRLR